MSDTPRTDHALDIARKLSVGDEEWFFKSAAGLLGDLARQLERENNGSQAEAHPNHGGSVGEAHGEQSPATRLKVETPAVAAPIRPIYFVGHPDGSYSVADPQPGEALRRIIEHNLGCINACGKHSSYPHVRESRRCDESRDCSDCPLEWTIDINGIET